MEETVGGSQNFLHIDKERTARKSNEKRIGLSSHPKSRRGGVKIQSEPEGVLELQKLSIVVLGQNLLQPFHCVLVSAFSRAKVAHKVLDLEESGSRLK